ncbi:MAG: methylmalonyl Co-A mutase-associated GTPase MeaB [Candidatus Marinimicrobia bacterium]|nr:methylmalonyl Co-A mutase-associated GTPase MeaB [Candidatus Neomarinimicrobiota bacterium]
MTKELLERLRVNDVRFASRLMSDVENNVQSKDMNDLLYAHSLKAVRIGITGPPGAGKSTLIDQLIDQFRKDGKTIGVVTVDPTSPFSGGSLLGDRIRMSQHTLDKGVFVRSMGSRGMIGGLARKSHLLGEVLACTGKDYILFETIGVGQAETEIIQNVDITIVVLVPEAGDEVQFMKAGPIEVADLFVVNKCDRDGAERVSELLSEYLQDGKEKGDNVPEIFLTSSTSGHGIEDLHEKALTLIERFKSSGELELRRERQYLKRVQGALRDELVAQFWNGQPELDMDAEITALRRAKKSPFTAAKYLVDSLNK